MDVKVTLIWNKPEWCAVIDKEVANDGNDHTVQKKEDKPEMMIRTVTEQNPTM